MSRMIDLTGQRFGRLTVIGRSEDKVMPRGKREIRWHCKCDCGNEVDVLVSNLRGGHSTSCGCYSREIRLEINRKTFKKHNEYRISGNVVIGYTKSGKEFYFDLEDLPKVQKFYWVLSPMGYVVSTDPEQNHKRIALHRLVMNAGPGEVIDHINHQLTQNCKWNLRSTTTSRNGQNRKLNSNNTSGYPGVYQRKDTSKWEVSIQVLGKRMYLGVFETKEDAVAARKAAEEKYFGEYSYDNSMAASPVIEVA